MQLDSDMWPGHRALRSVSRGREGCRLSTMTQIGDVSTWWTVRGDGDPLVLMHPGGADSRAWDDNLPGLARHLRVFQYDRRGQGRTPDIGRRSKTIVRPSGLHFGTKSSRLLL